MQIIDLLIVDDSVTQRQFTRELCEDMGHHQLREAIHGAFALDMLREKAADVVVVDLEMPVMDGVELIRHIAREKLAQAVIVLSAKDPVLISSVGTMAEADGLVVLGTFKKPLNGDLLRCALRHNLVANHNIEDKNKEKPKEVSASELSAALDAGHIGLYYQPKLSCKGLLLKGVEALARWQDPVRGLISPDQFIEVAERHGIMAPLTRHLFEQALQQKKYWQTRGMRFHLAFNLSPLSLPDPTLSETIRKLTERYGVPPAEITLEVTENALLEQLASSIQTLARLRLDGFNIAIDDYGSGFANAQQLSRIPATELKLDRSLVHKAASRPQQRAILNNAIKLANELGLITVAEGVEHQDDLQLLRELGVRLVQGFLLARPMPADKLERWVQSELSVIRKNLG